MIFCIKSTFSFLNKIHKYPPIHSTYYLSVLTSFGKSFLRAASLHTSLTYSLMCSGLRIGSFLETSNKCIIDCFAQSSHPSGHNCTSRSSEGFCQEFKFNQYRINLFMICYSKYDLIIKPTSCEFLFHESFGKGIKTSFIIYTITKYGMNDYFIICFQPVFMSTGKYLFL